MKPVRFPYRHIESGQAPSSELAYLPITLSMANSSMDYYGLLDTGSTVNVLPYTVGLALGLVWEKQTIPVVLTGSLSRLQAYAVIVTGRVERFSPVELAFAWTQVADVPLILGQVNFMMEFDVCFFGSQAAFEVAPKTSWR